MPDDTTTPRAQACDDAEGQRGDPCRGPAVECRGIRLVLLDIEGTTCPVQFVSETLFPYAAKAMEGFLRQEGGHRADVKQLLEEVRQAWGTDDDPQATALALQSPDDLAAYLRQLIRRDSKLPALKALQGLIWRSGYGSGELVAPLFADVPSALRRWRMQGLELAVYSSGSIPAQQLLYGHSTAGDLSHLFGHWFDTSTGPKQQSRSYRAIAAQLQLAPPNVLFISDSKAECQAAQDSGMDVVFSIRTGNPHREPDGFRSISDFGQLVINGR